MFVHAKTLESVVEGRYTQAEVTCTNIRLKYGHVEGSDRLLGAKPTAGYGAYSDGYALALICKITIKSRQVLYYCYLMRNLGSNRIYTQGLPYISVRQKKCIFRRATKRQCQIPKIWQLLKILTAWGRALILSQLCCINMERARQS